MIKIFVGNIKKELPLRPLKEGVVERERERERRLRMMRGKKKDKFFFKKVLRIKNS